MILRLAKQDLAGLVAGDGAVQGGQCPDTALHGRPGSDDVNPFLEGRVVGPGDAMVFPVAQPREDGDVGNRVLVAGDGLAARQLLVYLTAKPSGGVGAAIGRVVDFPGRLLADQHGANLVAVGCGPGMDFEHGRKLWNYDDKAPVRAPCWAGVQVLKHF